MPPALRATSKVPLKRQAVRLFLNTFFQSCHVPCVWLSRGTVVKGPPANAGNVSSIPGSRDSPESAEENSTRSSSSLRNSMDRVAWRVQSVGSQRVRHHRAMEHPRAFYTSALFHLWVNQMVYMWRVFCIHFTLFEPPLLTQPQFPKQRLIQSGIPRARCSPSIWKEERQVEPGLKRNPRA